MPLYASVLKCKGIKKNPVYLKQYFQISPFPFTDITYCLTGRTKNEAQCCCLLTDVFHTACTVLQNQYIRQTCKGLNIRVAVDLFSPKPYDKWCINSNLLSRTGRQSKVDWKILGIILIFKIIFQVLHWVWLEPQHLESSLWRITFEARVFSCCLPDIYLPSVVCVAQPGSILCLSPVPSSPLRSSQQFLLKVAFFSVSEFCVINFCLILSTHLLFSKQLVNLILLLFLQSYRTPCEITHCPEFVPHQCSGMFAQHFIIPFLFLLALQLSCLFQRLIRHFWRLKQQDFTEFVDNSGDGPSICVAVLTSNIMKQSNLNQRKLKEKSVH